MGSQLSLFFGAALWISLITATGLDPVDNFCSRWYHQSQVKNGILYIDGGIEAFSDRTLYNTPSGDGANYTGPRILGVNNYIIAVDMSTSWDWKTNVSETVINKTHAVGTENYVPNVQSAGLFHGPPDDPQIYLYGGVTPDVNTSFPEFQWPTTNQYTLWGFNTENEEWTQYDVLLDVRERPSYGAAAELPEHGLAFYLNGILTNMSSITTEGAGFAPTTLEGMVVLDLQNQTATNRSTDTVADTPRTRGGMVAIPQIGNRGVLISIGGATGVGDSLRPVSMSQVNIFDVDTVTSAPDSESNDGWYTQTMTGKSPAPRVDFCLILASAPDNSSFNIHMYGGWDPIQNEYFDDIWVLSVPSFTWIQVFQGSSPRFGHTCHGPLGGRQMITVGGIGNGTDPAGECDWEYRGVAVFDLTNLGWGSVFDAGKPPYRVPADISDVVGGGPGGGATRLFPDGGWTSTLVARLFTGSESQTAPFAPPSGSGGSSSGSGSGDTGGNSGPNVGAIAGGVVGGVVFLGLVVAAFSWWWRRRSRRRAAAAAGAAGAGAGATGPAGEEEPAGPPPLPKTPSEVKGNPVHEMPSGQTGATELEGDTPASPLYSSPVSPDSLRDF